MVFAEPIIYLFDRSPHWFKLREEIVLSHPFCSFCYCDKELEAHHVLPYYLWPEYELDRNNIVILCRDCHFKLGHLGNWKHYNPTIQLLIYLKQNPPKYKEDLNSVSWKILP